MNALNRCIFAAALLAPLLAQAATFTVNSTADPGDGSCDASECTLREAITAANANANATEVDMIYFGVAGGGVHSIQPMEALPTIIEPVLIDGYQSPQAGATPWSLENGVEIPPILVIELNGDAIAEGKPNGLTFAAGSEGSTLRGLVINGWEEAGVRITGVAGVNIEGNIFGLDASGLNAKPHEGAKSRAGVHIDGPSTVTVGGPAISQRNVLGGFDDNGSSTAGISTNSGGHTLVIENNFIGTIITGDRSAGGNGHGIYRGTFGAFDIPSTVTIRDNLISGNGRHGVNFSGSGTSSFTGSIVSNRIGVAYASNDEVSNGGDGIQWRDGEVTIGGDSAELGNVIAHNAGYGVNGLGAGLYARHNAIFANGNLGLRGNVRAVEVLSAWVRHDGSSLIRFAPESDDENVDLYVSDACGEPGKEQGERYLGRQLGGHGFFDASHVPAEPLVLGQGITTLRQTDSGRTSSFSNCVTVTAWNGGDMPGIATVNSTDDGDDGSCDANHCSLREAIDLANASDLPDGEDVTAIHFNIPGAGPHTIQPTSALPAISSPSGGVLIDGFTQPGASRNTLADGMDAVLKIVLDGGNAGNEVDGLKLDTTSYGDPEIGTFRADGTVIQGLVISNFSRLGINNEGGDDVTIRGNFIGTDVTGTLARPNGNFGIGVDGFASSSNLTIGGPNPADRNLISGNFDPASTSNARGGIEIYRADQATVQNNWIGIAADGVTPLPNNGHGIYLQDGDFGRTLNNVISGNLLDGIHFGNVPRRNTTIQGNKIGLGIDDQTPVGNGGRGIRLGDTNTSGTDSASLIGGTAGQGNHIAYNGAEGIVEELGERYTDIRGNRIHDNGQSSGTATGLAIRFVQESNFRDDGPFLTIQSAESDADGTYITGVTDAGTGVDEIEIDFFANDACAPSGFGDAQQFLGTLARQPDDAPFEFFTPTQVPLGHVVTASLTAFGGSNYGGHLGTRGGVEEAVNGANIYSGLSRCFVVTAVQTPGELSFVMASYSVDETDGTVRAEVQRRGGSSGAVSVDYATSDGTATAGEDYTASSGTLNWADGELGTKSFDMPIVEDAVDDEGETFTVVLSNVVDAELTQPSTVTITIHDVPPGTTPDPFSFDPVTDSEPDTVVSSNTVTVSGLQSSVPISVTAGEYRIGDGSFTSADGAVSNGDTVTLRLTSSSAFSTEVVATLTIGGAQADFRVTTRAGNITPDNLDFSAQSDVEKDTPVESNVVTIAGLGVPAAISVSGGEYRIDGGSYTAADGEISNGQTVQIRLQSSPLGSTSTQATLSVGDGSGTFNVTTRADDTTPDELSFNAVTDVEPGEPVLSNNITVSGLETAVPISISNGEYRIGDGSFTGVTGSVSNGDEVTVRVTSSPGFSTEVIATLTIGGGSATFSVTTRAASTTPSGLPFVNQAGVEKNVAVQSNVVTIDGLEAPAAISIAGGRYRIDGGAYTTEAGQVSNGQTVQLELQSSAQGSATTQATLTVGELSSSFTVTTRADDTTPDAFEFVDQSGAEKDTLVVSDPAITVSGLEAPAEIGVTGGSYRIDDGPFTDQPGRVSNGEAVRVQLRSSSQGDATVEATLTIGGISDSFRVTTRPDNTTPGDFTLVDQSGVEKNTPVVSAPVSVTGLEASAAISIVGGEYSVDGAAFTSAAGQVDNDQPIRVRLQSAATGDTTTEATLTIGGVSDTFSVTTRPDDTMPDAFGFAPVGNVELDTPTESSESITVTGINEPTAVSVSGGRYSMDGGAYTADAGLVSAGQQLRVELVSASTPATPTELSLTIGGVVGTFRVTTRAADATPNGFEFDFQNNVERDVPIASETVEIGGLEGPASISISGGQYRIDGGDYTAAAGTISNGQSVQLQVRSSPLPAEDAEAVLTIGGVSATFRVRTAPDKVPDPLQFDDALDLEPGQEVSSNIQTIRGLAGSVTISLTGIGGGDFTYGNSDERRTSVQDSFPNESVSRDIQLFSQAPTGFGQTKTLTLRVGDSTFDWVLRTRMLDTEPDAFNLGQRANQPRSTLVLSDTVTLDGFEGSLPIVLDAGDNEAAYSVNGGPFTAQPGLVVADDSVVVRVRSSSAFNSTQTVTLSVGGRGSRFRMRTEAADSEPDDVTFQPVAGADATAPIDSNTVTISGVNHAIPIAISGGQYRINNGAFTSASGEIGLGDTLQLRVPPTNDASRTRRAIVYLGHATARSFEVTSDPSLGADRDPDDFGFRTVVDAEPGALVSSALVTVTGFDGSLPVAVRGGQASVGGRSFRSRGLEISAGQRIQARLRASRVEGETVQMQVRINDAIGTFVVVTRQPEEPPLLLPLGLQITAVPGTTATSACQKVNISAPKKVLVRGGRASTTKTCGGGQSKSLSASGFVTKAEQELVLEPDDFLLISADIDLGFGASKTVELTIGEEEYEVVFATPELDSEPVPVVFSPRSGTPGTAVISEPVEIAGINVALPIRIDGGEYRLDDGAFSSEPGFVDEGQIVTLRAHAPTTPRSTSQTVLTIGASVATFSVTALATPTPVPQPSATPSPSPSPSPSPNPSPSPEPTSVLQDIVLEAGRVPERSLLPRGTRNVAMLSFVLKNDDEGDALVQRITSDMIGEGAMEGIQEARLVLDRNRNGEADVGELVLARLRAFGEARALDFVLSGSLTVPAGQDVGLAVIVDFR